MLGHSWGGLLGQTYTAAHPERVLSLALSSSSLGVGAEWKRTKHEAFLTGRRRAGLWRTVRLFAYGSALVAPGPISAWSMRHVMTETWHNYFLHPGSAPDSDPTWLHGSSAQAIIRTDRAVSSERPDVLAGLSRYTGPVLILYGSYDIFGAATDIVRRRFPNTVQMTLDGSGHLHWLQNPAGYAAALRDFYDDARFPNGHRPTPAPVDGRTTAARGSDRTAAPPHRRTAVRVADRRDA